jgi:hypothetical protein
MKRSNIKSCVLNCKKRRRAMGEKSIEMKRVVMVKAIVTQAFKDNLVAELERAVKNIDRQSKEMSRQADTYMTELNENGLFDQSNAFKGQLSEEKGRQQAAKADLLAKIQEAQRLVLNSEFVQGPLEGPVTVSVGDNLYKKIGAAEIVVKDGVTVEIRNAE